MSPSRLLVAALLATSATLLLACGDGDAEVGSGGDTVGPVDDGDAGSDGSAAGGGAGTSDSRELTLAVTDAAERTGLAEDDIELKELSMVTWPDGAIGCPQPDVMYTQALVDGYRIILDAGGRQLVYHGAIGEDPFLCEDPQEPVPPAG